MSRGVGCSCGADAIPGSIHASHCDDNLEVTKTAKLGTRRCRLFGHRWGYWTGTFWLSVAWCAGGAEDFLVCRRCGVERWEDPNG